MTGKMKNNLFKKSLSAILSVLMLLSCTVLIAPNQAAALDCEQPETEIRGKVAASCVTEGYSGDTYCKLCGEMLESGKIESTADHIYGEKPSSIIEATCSTERTLVYKCKNCAGTKRVVLDKDKGQFAPHSLFRATKVEPTCDKSGYDATYCINCGTNIEVTETPPLGHTDNDGDGVCDVLGCGGKLAPSGGNNVCTCICHKEDGIWSILYDIVCFFWKLLKITPSCACGNIHY